ncbi:MULTISPECIES: Gfo/Idh/MocA family protein [unclassified Erwinia]|uniref:Gfo/Idh/MocA family protein n=1 Tax=unclassified Erwinia TaxID=2622719 RepID=UPI0006F6E512|nr:MULTISPECIES: Gfo/Idh/MocA family oxidoreductase [unclassified Erwinia]KQN53470.1 oxidoreductase [Erwinia sp. Leaf53]PLV61879.1 oxidoreductase [Erwinia sp. B116]
MFPSHLPKARIQDPHAVPALRWGIIGPGWIAERFAKSLKESTAQQLVAVASRSYERASAFAGKTGIAQAFGSSDDLLAQQDIDAVYIATPHNHHYPDALKALQAGKHVLIEKPLALNGQQARALAELSRAKGLLCMEAMWCDFLPKYDVISQLLEDGALGDLHTLLADHGEYFTPDHRIFNADLAGGPMMDLGSYLIGLSVKVAGAPTTIHAAGQSVAGGLNGQTSMLLTHNNGMHSVLNTTLFSNTPGAAVIAGRDATLQTDGCFYAPGPFTLTASQGGKTLTWDEPRNRYDQLFHEAVHFAWCVGQGKTDSPIRPLSLSIATLDAIDEVRRQIGQVFNEEK